MPVSQQFLQEQITATEAQIVAAQTAESQLVSGAILSYTLDTGQTRQTVTKQNVAVMGAYIESLYNRLATLCARKDGSGVTHGVPDY